MIDLILNILITSLPFREHYHPTIFTAFVYLIPFLFGILIFLFKKDRPLEYCLLFSLIITIIFDIFGIFVNNTFISMVLFYYGFVFILISYIGCTTIFLIKNFQRYKGLLRIDQVSKLNKRYFFLSLLIIIFFVTINLIPYLTSNFLVGADVYFNAAISKNSFTPHSTTHPYFKESELFPYWPQGFTIQKILNIISFISLNDFWLLIAPFSTFLSLTTIFFISRRLWGDKESFFTLLFVGPLNQFLFNDPSLRILAYFLFLSIILISISLITSRFKGLLLMGFIITIALFFYHIEIFLHLIISLIFFILLLWIKPCIKSSYKFDFEFISRIVFIFSLTSILIIFYLIGVKPISSIIIFNEVAFSLIYPIGPISIIVGIFFISFIVSRNEYSIQEYLIFSVTLLSTNLLFYFLLIWGFYHRYFIETAYIFMSLFAGVFCVKLIKESSKIVRFLLVMGLILLLISSILPRMINYVNYSKGVNNFVQTKSETLDYLQNLSILNKDKVVLSPPKDFINRFIPVYTDFFVFTGYADENIAILPFCGDFGYFIKTCSQRESLGIDFLENPSKESLNNMRESYEVDYLVISKTDPYYSIDKFKPEYAIKIYENNHYVVYELVK